MNETANNLVTITPLTMMDKAIEKGIDVEALNKLMEMQFEYEKREAKKAFDEALAKFQHECPVIEKTKKVKFNTVEYSYAPLESIVEQIKDLLKECGFTYRWSIHDRTLTTTDGEADAIQADCILTHVQGHSECNSMTAFPDSSGSKNSIQARGSTVTYLQRYTLIGVLGLTSANQDDDGKDSSAFDLVQYNALVRELFISIYVVKQAIFDKDLSVAVEAMAELSREEKDELWKAPTKGGIFTTKEREVMRSSEWRNLSFQYDTEHGIEPEDPTKNSPDINYKGKK